MPNKRFNKQVPGFGFKNGGRAMKSAGGPAEKRDIRKVEQTIGSSMSSKREKGRMKAMGGGRMISGTRRKDEASGFYSPDMGMRGGSMYKKGGAVKKVGKKKQGYKDRKDESIAMRIKKKRTPKQLKASRDESYGKFGSKAKKKGKINR